MEYGMVFRLSGGSQHDITVLNAPGDAEEIFVKLNKSFSDSAISLCGGWDY